MEKITLYQGKENCSGCGACMLACPVQAITMEEDDLGCLYPKIQESLCIHCGKCLRSCDYKAPKLSESLRAYAAVGKQEEAVKQSASGGVFAMLAQSCLSSGGMVAGVVMELGDGNADVYHLLSGNSGEIPAMQGSKYVHSQAWRCYQALQKALKEGKTVLFSGTPCQAAAVKRMTGDPANLITVDLVCHGVPPMKLLKDYIKILEKRLGGTITDFRFRDKTAPKPFTAKICVKKGSKDSVYRLRSNMLSYYAHFLEGATYRENCYHCPYAGGQRAADLTIGDYWGIEKFHSEDMRAGRLPQRNDWSCVLVNTEKGKQFLQAQSESLALYPTELPWVAATNRQLTEPSKKHPDRDQILEVYRKGGYPAVEKLFVRKNGGAVRFWWRMHKAKNRLETEKNYED